MNEATIKYLITAVAIVLSLAIIATCSVMSGPDTYKVTTTQKPINNEHTP